MTIEAAQLVFAEVEARQRAISSEPERKSRSTRWAKPVPSQVELQTRAHVHQGIGKRRAGDAHARC